jgi:hypothetical protein
MRKIYGLFDPRKPGEFRVIGETKSSIAIRLCGYISQARLKQRRNWPLPPSYVWILKLLDQDIRPSIRLIEICRKETWRQRERRAITLYRSRGHRLLNVHPGGVGKEDGGRKLFCDKCGTRRVFFQDGTPYCPKCARARNRTPKQRAYRRAYSRAYRKTQKGRAYERNYQRTPEYKAAARARQRKPMGKAYQRDWGRAVRRGLTVKELRRRGLGSWPAQTT